MNPENGMKKSRNLDRDGLDGILPPADKATIASRQAKEQAQAKPTRGKVIWLFTGAASLLAGVILLQILGQEPASVSSDIASSSQSIAQQSLKDNSPPLAVAPSAQTQTLVASSDAAIKESNLNAGNAETMKASATNEATPTQTDRQAAEAKVLAQLPTEPTSAGVTQILTEPAPPRLRNSAPSMPVLATVYFKFDSSKPVSRRVNEFDDLFNAAKRCSEIKLTGHTCNLGSALRNQQLGLARADALKKILVGRGYAAERVFTESAGMNEPAAPNDTKAGQALNRRVVLQCLQAVN